MRAPNRLISTFALAAALCGIGGHARADDPLVERPLVDWKQCAAPSYPRAALKKDEEAMVILGVRVDANGAVLETRILLSTGSPALGEATKLAFQKCRYMPGKVNGQPTAMWMALQYFWTLEPTDRRLVSRLARAALDGKAEARYLLATILEAQAETDADRKAALELELSAAEAGESMAQTSMGMMYQRGTLVARDMNEARRWYAKAAAQGNVLAAEQLRFIGAR